MMDFTELDEKEEERQKILQPDQGAQHAPEMDSAEPDEREERPKETQPDNDAQHAPEADGSTGAAVPPKEDEAQPAPVTEAGSPPAEEGGGAVASTDEADLATEEGKENKEEAASPQSESPVDDPGAGGKEILADPKSGKAAKDISGMAKTPFFKPETWEQLDRRSSEIPGVKSIAETLNLSPLTVACVGSCGFLAFLLHGVGGQLLCTLLGFLYPAYKSFQAAEHCQPSVMQFWLTYWVVWACWVTVEHCCYYVLIWVPFYYPVKLATLVWLFHPATRGARFVYRWLLLPVLLRHQERIDAALEESSQQLKRGVSGALSGAVGMGLNTAMAAGAGAVPRVRSMSGVVMEAILARRLSTSHEEDDQ